ncbi:MAG: hypothetical protein KDA89_08905 [Planctomycetaceae bacterium]|nr:hypothetical protein [Planctomycetaceae bacterium]
MATLSCTYGFVPGPKARHNLRRWCEPPELKRSEAAEDPQGRHIEPRIVSAYPFQNEQDAVIVSGPVSVESRLTG